MVNFPVYSLQEASPDDFSAITLSLTMVSDHFPDRYVGELDKVVAQLRGQSD